MNSPSNIPLSRPFSVPQLAHRWGCSEGLIRKMIRDGRLQCFRPGTLIRISAAEVERFECQQQVGMGKATRAIKAEIILHGWNAYRRGLKRTIAKSVGHLPDLI